MSEIKDNLDLILEKYWGYTSFRPLQREIIMSVVDGRDTIGLLPTGGGKSITFQVPAMAFDGLTIVVTPLISLMKDQVDNLRDRNIRAVYLHSGLTMRETRLAYDRCRLGKARLLYVSPEKLMSQSFLTEVKQFDVSLIVVDEAHCISQWGYDFRPSYLKISDLRSLFPSVPVLALTASATSEVIDDIGRQLKMKDPAIFRRSFDRPNISYVVRYCDYKEGKIIEILQKIGGSAIVYTRSRRRTREVAGALNRAGISADYYHAGLLPEEKDEKQNSWKNGETRVIVATTAFGMGIDKPDVRIVIHHDIPSSLEEYYQEAGRAGRDGKPAFAVLVCSNNDKGLLTRRLTDAFPEKEVMRSVYDHVSNFLDVAPGEGFNRMFEFNLAMFCKLFNYKETLVRNSLQLLTQAGYIDYSDEISMGSRVMMQMNRHELYDIRLSRDEDAVLQLILRMHTGLFSDYAFINEHLIAHDTGLTDEAVYQALLSLSRQHVLHYIPRKTSPYIFYTTSREDPKHILFPRAVYEERRERMKTRIEAIRSFSFEADKCRVNTMLSYFGEAVNDPCGRCDVCRANASSRRTSGTSLSLDETLLYLASASDGRTLDYILANTGPNHRKTIETLRCLVDRGDIVFDKGRYYKN